MIILQTSVCQIGNSLMLPCKHHVLLMHLMFSGKVWNIDKQIGICISLFMHFFLIKIVSQKSDLLPLRWSWSVSKCSFCSKIIQDCGILTHCLKRFLSWSNCPIHKRVGKLFPILGIFKRLGMFSPALLWSF